MTIRDVYIGQEVCDILTGFRMTIVGLGANYDRTNGVVIEDGSYVYCDFVGNEGDILEYVLEDLEPYVSDEIIDLSLDNI